jgi:hypothetical protein
VDLAFPARPQGERIRNVPADSRRPLPAALEEVRVLPAGRLRIERLAGDVVGLSVAGSETRLAWGGPAVDVHSAETVLDVEDVGLSRDAIDPGRLAPSDVPEVVLEPARFEKVRFTTHLRASASQVRVASADSREAESLDR